MTVRTQGLSLISRDDEAYKQTRQNMLFNRLVPDRRPDVIARAATSEDVAEAVQLARSRGMKVAVRTGGHSFCGSPLRDGGMLIDLSQLRELSIDPTSGAATLEPAVTSRELARSLGEHGLGFPVAHHGEVPLGGYLLCGGFGWNMGSWGPACFNVKRVEVVTAAGEIVTADAETNTDLFWAARGSGPGFFGVATRFQIQVHPLPHTIKTSTHLYSLEDVAEIAQWTAELAPTLPPHLELLLGLTPRGAAIITGTTFADSEAAADRTLEPLESCPTLGRALDRQVGQPSSFDALQDTIETLLPSGHRYIADTLWSNHDLAELLPTLATHVARAPSPTSLVLAVHVPPPPPGARLPDAAFSMVAKTIVLFYAIWENADQDQTNRRWLNDTVSSVEPLGVGHYIAEADLPAAPTRATGSFAAPHWERLEALRAQHDPDRVFHTYLGLGRHARAT
jgi:FAD/FMN-containing dehydrogenase